MSQTYQTISHIALIILCRMIEATTTFTSTSTTRSYTPQQEQEQQQQEQHEHLTSLLGFRSEPGHLKCRSSLRGREWHIESALQVPPSPAPLMWHAPFPIYTHKHTHTNLPPTCTPTTPIWCAMCGLVNDGRRILLSRSSPAVPFPPPLSLSIAHSLPVLQALCVECGGDCKNKLTWKLKKAKKKL